MDDSSLGRGWEFFSSPPRPDRLWGPPSLLYNGYQGLFHWEVMRLGCEADHSPPCSAEVKNAWSYISTPQYAFMKWCSVKAQELWNISRYSLNICLHKLRKTSVIWRWMTQKLSVIVSRYKFGRKLFSSPLCPARLWDPFSLLSNGYRGGESFPSG
jgi:hypothetical protein